MIELQHTGGASELSKLTSEVISLLISPQSRLVSRVLQESLYPGSFDPTSRIAASCDVGANVPVVS